MCIALTCTALNGLKVTACDIKNTCLQALSSEKHYITCSTEFGDENASCVALIRRALCGRKSSGADFWKHLCSCMNFLTFKFCKTDPDV